MGKAAMVLLVAVALGPAALGAQGMEGTVAGVIGSAEGPVAGAEVRALVPGSGGAGVEATSRTRSDGDGRYRLRLAAGSHVLEVRAFGHRAVRAEVEVPAGGTVQLDVELEASALVLDPVVVTGTMKETRVSESPVKVDVVSGSFLRRNAGSSLMESLGQVNGLYAQMDCAVCYTNSIRINGMEGPYTAVLIDGMPIMGALASVYGLNGIDPSLIEQLEILKGPQSTLYGTEAMGGVVNVITKDPRFAPRWSVDGSRTSVGETRLNFAAAPDGEEASGLVSGSVHHMDRFVDENGDGFSDQPLMTRVSLFGKAELRRDGRPALGVAGKLYREERFGGVESWTEADRGSGEVYGEFIRTNRAELMGRWQTPWPGLRAELSYAYHDQESYYGDQTFLAEQHIGFGQLVWDRPRGDSHDVVAGVTVRARAYDDDTPATAEAERRLIPGVFVQDEWRAGYDWTLLGGLRADHHGEHGPILSPRLSVKWQPLEQTVFRMNLGSGFRVVNLFTEDHAALTGSRRVVIEGNLAPERSRSVAFNANQVLEMGGNPMMIDLDLFHTHFNNRIRPDYEADPGLIVYRNLRGHSVSRGAALSVNQNFVHLPILYTLGVTVQDVFVQDEAGRERELFAPRVRGVWSLAYTFPGPLTLDWTGTLMGSMRLPSYPEPFTRPTRSDAHVVHNLQATWEAAAGVSVYLGVKNLGDFTQGSPLVAPEDPFGDAFDTNYVWGPLVGRTVMAGARIATGR